MALIARKAVIEKLYEQTYERILSLDAQSALIQQRIFELIRTEDEPLRLEKQEALEACKKERNLHRKMLKQLKIMHDTAEKDGEVIDEAEEGKILTPGQADIEQILRG